MSSRSLDAQKQVRARRCPKCGRLGALGRAHKWKALEGHVRTCRYCKHEVGILYGKTFGYEFGAPSRETP